MKRKLIVLGCLLTTIAWPLRADGAEAWPVQLRAKIARVNEIGFKLQAAVAPSACQQVLPALGAEFDSLDNYADGAQDLARKTLGLGSVPQIAAVAIGSPAALAGLVPGDELLKVGEVDAVQIASGGDALRTSSDRVHDAIVASLRNGPVPMTVRRGSLQIAATIVPRVLCSAHANVATRRAVTAHKGGSEVIVTTGLIDFVANDDELALVMAHEFSHSFLAHGKARDVRARREMEIEADTTGAKIARCAGYDLGVAARFWHRYGKRDIFPFLRAPTHESPAKRELRISALAAVSPPACPVPQI